MANITYGDVELDLDRYEVRRSGTVVPAEPQVFDVLVHLARNAHRVVTKEELLDSVWGDRFVSESALTSRIKAARRCIGDDGRAQRIIATVHGRGYRMVVPVATMEPAPSTDASTMPIAGFRADEALVERDDVIDSVLQAVTAAESGSGRVLCISGEAGMGKTAVVRAVRRAVQERADVVVGECEDLSTPEVLGGIRDLASHLPDDLRDAVLSQPRGDVVLDALRALHRRSGAATVVILEDLHWADDATLDVIRFVGRRVRSEHLVVVLTHREEGIELTHPLHRLLGSLRGSEVRRMQLQPLSESAIAALADGSSMSAREILLATSGNPFFVTELISAPAGEIPRTVKDAVLAKLADLPPRGVAGLQSLSVVPGRVEWWLAREMLGGDDELVAAGERAGLLTGDAERLWFRHELTRRAIESTLAAVEKVRLNGRVARLLLARGAEPSRIMHHAVLSDDVDLVVEIGAVAADDAVRSGAHRQAIEYLGDVLRHGSRLSDRRRAEMLTLRSHSLYLVNRFEEALHAAVAAVALAEELDDATLLARALLTLGRTVLWARGPDAAQRAVRRALELLEPDGDVELRAVAHADLARALGELTTVGSVAEGNPEAVDHAMEALRLADTLDRQDLRGYALTYLGCERLAVGDERGATDLADAVRHLRGFPRTELAVRACVNAAGASYRAGRLADAERYVETGLALGADAEFFSGEYRLRLTRAGVRFSSGLWDAAEAELRLLLGLAGEPGIMAPLARAVLARILARRGRITEARDVLAPAMEAAVDSEELRLVGPVAISRVELAWLGGEPDVTAFAAPVFQAATGTGRLAATAEISRYLQRAGCSVARVEGAPEPWAAGLRGDHRRAAALWSARDEPYEQALELLECGAGADSEGRRILERLGATATIVAVAGRDGSGHDVR